MKKKLFILVLTLHQICQTAIAQQINIGEKCPDIKLKGVMNYHSAEADLLTAFNNKPLIIDFWFITCAPCLETILRLDSLQKAYKDRFNILLATTEKEEDIKKFFTHHEKFKNIKHPIVYTDNLTSDLRKLFPHTGEPHEVWIGKNGVVQAITTQYEITAENIEKFLKGDTLNLPEKMTALDSKYAMGETSMLVGDDERSGGKRKLIYSWLGTADPRVPGMTAMKRDTATKGRRLIYENTSFITLYKIAYSPFRSKWQVENGEQIKALKQFKDTARFESDHRTWKNIFCYEVFSRDSSEFRIKKIMQRDLDNYFQLESKIRQQRIKYFVLSRLKDHSNYNTFSAKEILRDGYVEKKGDSISIKSIYMQYLAQNHLYNSLPYDVINETGYFGAVDIVIPKTSNIQKIKQALNKYGLDINQETRTENILILQDAVDQQ